MVARGAAAENLLMPRGPATFKQSDVTRAVKAARASGIEPNTILVLPEGIIVTRLETKIEAKQQGSSWDDFRD